MGITPDALARARTGLKSTSRDQALVDRFIAIRNYNVARGTADARATLTAEEIQVLQSLIVRSSPAIQVMPKVVASTFGGGTRAEMVFRTAFKSKVPAGPPYRVIRFVRAAQVNRVIRYNKEEYTVPGYVCYRPASQVQSKTAPDPQTVHAALTRCFSMSKWSFDGPRQEFEGGRLMNEDTPGTQSSDLPYGIMADFLIVLYDENARTVLEAGRAAGWLCVWQGWPQITPTFVRTR